MNGYLEAIRPKMSEEDYNELCALTNPKVFEFIAKSSDLCNCEKIFVCSDSDNDIAYVRQQAIATSEETKLKLEGHTVHFDGMWKNVRSPSPGPHTLPETACCRFRFPRST